MGFRLAVSGGAENINLDEKTIQKVTFSSDSATDSNARATDFGIAVKITGKMLYKVGADGEDGTLGLSKWSQVPSEQADCYRNAQIDVVSAGQVVRKYTILTREDALSMLQEKRIYNYLGKDGFKEIQFYDKPVRLQEGDVVAVFSNGMQESVTWKEMEDCLARKKSCKRMAFDLVELVNQKKGDKDNASVILIRVGEMT